LFIFFIGVIKTKCAYFVIPKKRNLLSLVF
jgi:hypothetical protein